MKLLLDHQLIPAAAAPELPHDHPGGYETLWWRQGEPVFWTDHWERFAQALRYYDLPAPWTEAGLREAINRLAAANGVNDGVVRYMVWRDEDAGNVSLALPATRAVDADARVRFRIDVTPPRPHMAKPAFDLTWAPAPVAVEPTTAHFKHLSRAAWRDATQRARQAGYDDALVVDASGGLLEAGTSNVFLVCGDELRTPPLGVRPLPGVMRQRLVAFARELGLPVREVRCTRADAEAADAVWLTNSLIGIRPVKRVDNRTFQLDAPPLGRLRDAWRTRYGWDPVVVM